MTKMPAWVMFIYNFLKWVDEHPVYLLPKRLLYWRYQFYDDWCLCIHCEERRKKGYQRPAKRSL